MKRSNTGLFIIIGFAALLIIVTIVGARIVIGNIFDGPAEYESERTIETAGGEEKVELAFDLTGFSELEVAGAGRLT